MEITLINDLNSNSITINEKSLSLIEVDNFNKQIVISQTVSSFTALTITSEINIQKSSITKIDIRL